MKISELIKQLEGIKGEFGDNEVLGIMAHENRLVRATSVITIGIGRERELYVSLHKKEQNDNLGVN